MTRREKLVFDGGRAALASLFLLGALNKLLQFDATAARMESVGLSPGWLLLPLTICFEAAAGAALALGRRFAAEAGLALAGFTLLTNLYFHRFWATPEALRPLELSLFFKNVAIAGALVAVAAVLRARRSPSS